jgi:hypothetical protein
MVTYTALSPANTCVVVNVCSLSRALELAVLDLAREWTPVRICYGHQHWDIDGILALLNARRVSAA